MQEYSEPQEWEDAFFKSWLASTARLPTTEEIKKVLAPWRPHLLRRIAKKCYGRPTEQVIWLRTFYGATEEEDAPPDCKFREMVDTTGINDYPSDDEEDDVYCILNDRDVFDFGDDWPRGFEVLPELIRPLNSFEKRPFPAGSENLVSDYQRDLKAEVEKLSQSQDPDVDLLANRHEATMLQCLAVQTFIVVANEETLTSGSFKVYWYNGRGDAVRSSRIEPDRVRTLPLNVSLTRWMDCSPSWTEGQVSSQYRFHGPYKHSIYDP
ncbi:Nucleoporin nup186 [Elsinoe australis]|uniref:Nucleoporin nup186 n=1 Tax=Elsinoe australis TaxID=40998 RepID=A0A2P7Z6A8_9PEZI|nr:Nucleoporin nup186 [Elsinoe australis]